MVDKWTGVGTCATNRQINSFFRSVGFNETELLIDLVFFLFTVAYVKKITLSDHKKAKIMNQFGFFFQIKLLWKRFCRRFYISISI